MEVEQKEKPLNSEIIKLIKLIRLIIRMLIKMTEIWQI